MSWRGRQIQTLLKEATAGGGVDVEWAVAWADGSVLLVLDESVDWGNPLSPALKGDAIFGLNDSKCWLSVPERHPTWINLAAYRDEVDRRMFVLSSSHCAGEIEYGDPAISFSSGPSGVTVRVV